MEREQESDLKISLLHSSQASETPCCRLSLPCPLPNTVVGTEGVRATGRDAHLAQRHVHVPSLDSWLGTEQTDDYTFKYDQTGMTSSYKTAEKSALDLQQLFAIGSSHRSSSFQQAGQGQPTLSKSLAHPRLGMAAVAVRSCIEWGCPRSHSKGPIPQSCLGLCASLRLELLRVFSRMLFLLTKPTSTFCTETLRSYMPLLAAEGNEGNQMQHFCTKQLFKSKQGRNIKLPCTE